MSKLLTCWLTICTAGPTIDGRHVADETLKEIAETYDKDDYTAVINYEHYFGNYGTVEAVQTITDKKGRTALQAKLCPNTEFVYQNKIRESKLFTSVEFIKNFAESGKAYLTGLALTDTPASLGTTEIKLSADRKGQQENFSSGTELTALDFDRIPDEKSGVFSKLKSIFSGDKTVEIQSKTNAEDPMNEEQFKAITDGNKAVVDAVEKLAEIVTPSNASKADETLTAANEELTAANEELTTKVEELTAKVEELSTADEPTKTPDNTGGESDIKPLV